MRKLRLVLALLLGAFVLGGCGKPSEGPLPTQEGIATEVPEMTEVPEPTATPTPKPTATPKPTPTPLPPCEPLYVEFKDGNSNSATMEIANGWSNGGQFNVTWRKSNCTFDENAMQLIISEDTASNKGSIP